MEQRKPRQLYKKLFRTYTLILLGIVLALVGYFLSATKKRIFTNHVEKAQRVTRDAAAYMQDVRQTADFLHRDLYRSQAELEDLLAYFSLGHEEYQRFSLDRFSQSPGIVYAGIHSFINEAFEAYGSLEKVELISYYDLLMTECYPEKKFYLGKNAMLRMKELAQDSYGQRGCLVIKKEIRNPDTMEAAGCMVFTFDGERAFQKISSGFDKAGLVVVQKNALVYASEEKAEWEEYVLGEREDQAAPPGYLVLDSPAEEGQAYTFMERREAAAIP